MYSYNEQHKEVGDRIRKARKNMGYSREKFSERLDISVKVLHNLEAGNQIPKGDLLYKIAKEIDQSMEYIMTGKSLLSCDNKKFISDIQFIIDELNEIQKNLGFEDKSK